MPVSEVKQDDTWYCAGLSATGSNTSVLDDVFVPEHRSVSFATLRDACSPGSKINTNPIYRTPFIAVHTYALLGAGAGARPRRLCRFHGMDQQRYLTYTQLNIAQHVPVQIRVAEIARADRRRRTAGAPGAGDGTRELHRHVDGDADAAAPRLHLCHAQMLRDAMDELVKISGSSGLMEDNPVQRCWRDVHAISSHVVMNWDVPAENFGRMEFGLGAQSGVSDVLRACTHKTHHVCFTLRHATSLDHRVHQQEQPRAFGCLKGPI